MRFIFGFQLELNTLWAGEAIQQSFICDIHRKRTLFIRNESDLFDLIFAADISKGIPLCRRNQHFVSFGSQRTVRTHLVHYRWHPEHKIEFDCPCIRLVHVGNRTLRHCSHSPTFRMAPAGAPRDF